MGSAPLKKITSIKSIVMDAAELALSGSNVKSVFKIPDDLWLVDADTGQLGQAFANVIINGKESMVEGGVIEIEVENLDEADKKGPRILPAKRYVKISVRDSGCGIAEEDLDTIFDPYFSTKQRGAQKGMGLGLTVVHSVIEKHYGHIHIESKPGKGTLVEILLPAIGKEHQFSERDSSRGILVVEHASQNMRIMVMDDEEIVRDVAFTMLTQSGYAVDLVHNGAEAVALYKKRMNSDSPIDLSILDLTIPGGMGGKDTILEIHKLNPDAKVVVSSGYSSDPIMINYGVYGFCGAIGKPYQFQEFVKVVAKSLREKP
jgi:CheY-like chemotaxis protein